ncbi:hypothetical protein PWT90_03728 [Aphanocladium album]|nr:hypothetical protein PWT90_03728 [Aphanocladium album]
MSTATQMDQGRREPKRHRVTRACDFCHRRSIRCQTPSGETTCQNCRNFDHQCTYHREPRRRGTGGAQGAAEAKVASGRPNTGRASQQTATRSDQPSSAEIPAAAVPVLPQGEGPSWAAPFVPPQGIIVDLLDIYFEIVYPIFPFFHQPSFSRRIARAEYSQDKALFAVTMAICALVTARVRDGAVSNTQWDLTAIHINMLRAHAVLAIASIQNGKIRDMHLHLGMYHTLVAMDGLHDESNWPTELGTIEREERRRLFWSIYTLDIYSSVVWGGIIRCRERQSRVAYPIEVDDEFIGSSAVAQPSVGQQGISPTSLRRLTASVTSDCWLSGWNFITDLYRVLEHALTRFRGDSGGRGGNSFLHSIFAEESGTTEASVSDSILQMYFDLPECFKHTPDMTFDAKRDRFAFQAANINGSLQLVRIVLCTAGGAGIETRCQIASEVVDSFMSIPPTYLLAISTPLLHHLGGIGTILCSVFGEPATESEHRMVQTVIVSMAQLLENLEPVHQSPNISQRLRDNAGRIDHYIASQRAANSKAAVTATAEQADSLTTQTNEGGSGLIDQNAPRESVDDLSALIQADILDQLAWSFNFGQSWN